MPRPSVERLVRDLLRRQKSDHPPVPVEDIARTLGATIRYLPLKEGEMSGMLYRDDSAVVIGVNSLHHPNRQRFTVAHELGHLMLHKGKEVRQVHIDKSFRVNRRDSVSSRATDAEEIEANLFASELLMPTEMLLRDLKHATVDFEGEDDLRSLADKYRVSLQAMVFRFNRLSGINVQKGTTDTSA